MRFLWRSKDHGSLQVLNLTLLPIICLDRWPDVLDIFNSYSIVIVDVHEQVNLLLFPRFYTLQDISDVALLLVLFILSFVSVRLCLVHVVRCVNCVRKLVIPSHTVLYGKRNSIRTYPTDGHHFPAGDHAQMERGKTAVSLWVPGPHSEYRIANKKRQVIGCCSRIFFDIPV